jgi:hypothetical protein
VEQKAIQIITMAKTKKTLLAFLSVVVICVVGLFGLWLLWIMLFSETENASKMREDFLLEIIGVILFALMAWGGYLWQLEDKDEAWADRWNSDRRMWTDKTGKFSTAAVFDELTDDNQVRILRMDRSEIIFPLSELSEKDIAYIDDFE